MIAHAGWHMYNSGMVIQNFGSTMMRLFDAYFPLFDLGVKTERHFHNTAVQNRRRLGQMEVERWRLSCFLCLQLVPLSNAIMINVIIHFHCTVLLTASLVSCVSQLLTTAMRWVVKVVLK